jgi:hypothetical protein
MMLLATGSEIDTDAIELTPASGGTKPAPHGESTAEGSISGLVGRRMDEVERDLILSTLAHTLGNRTHAATILGISLALMRADRSWRSVPGHERVAPRALRNKLRDYAAQGAAVPPPMLGVVA